MTASMLISELAARTALSVNSTTHIDNYVLAGNVAQSVTKPTNGNYVIFSADGDFYAAYDRTASTGSTGITDGTGSELNPVARDVRSVTTISINSTAARKISAMWYK